MESAVINATKIKAQEPARELTGAGERNLAVNLADVRSQAVLLRHVPRPIINIVISESRNGVRPNKTLRAVSTVHAKIRFQSL